MHGVEYIGKGGKAGISAPKFENKQNKPQFLRPAFQRKPRFASQGRSLGSRSPGAVEHSERLEPRRRREAVLGGGLGGDIGSSRFFFFGGGEVLGVWWLVLLLGGCVELINIYRF